MTDLPALTRIAFQYQYSRTIPADGVTESDVMNRVTPITQRN
jgi:hypothetical protein